MKVTLYSIPGSHPVRCARLMLEYKGIPYRRIDMLPVVSRFVIPHVLRFPEDRVPALKIDGRKVQGSRAISRELDRVKPEPPLFPADPGARAAVEEAEAWGDEELQPIPRTISWWALKQAGVEAQESFLTDAKLGLPPSVLARTGAPIIWAARKLNDSFDPTVKRLISEIPAALDKVDNWIAQGVLGGEQLNAADFQVGTSLRLLMTMEDLRPAIEARPAGSLALRVQPQAPGNVPKVFPPAWLEPLEQPVEA